MIVETKGLSKRPGFDKKNEGAIIIRDFEKEARKGVPSIQFSTGRFANLKGDPNLDKESKNGFVVDEKGNKTSKKDLKAKYVYQPPGVDGIMPDPIEIKFWKAAKPIDPKDRSKGYKYEVNIDEIMALTGSKLRKIN